MKTQKTLLGRTGKKLSKRKTSYTSNGREFHVVNLPIKNGTRHFKVIEDNEDFILLYSGAAKPNTPEWEKNPIKILK